MGEYICKTKMAPSYLCNTKMHNVVECGALIAGLNHHCPRNTSTMFIVSQSLVAGNARVCAITEDNRRDVSTAT